MHILQESQGLYEHNIGATGYFKPSFFFTVIAFKDNDFWPFIFHEDGNMDDKEWDVLHIGRKTAPSAFAVQEK